MQTPLRDIHSLPYMPQLDGLRAVCVLTVMVTHYWPEYRGFHGIWWGAEAPVTRPGLSSTAQEGDHE